MNGPVTLEQQRTNADGGEWMMVPWVRGGGAPLVTCTIITVPAAKSIAWLHDRMPAVLRTEADVTAWLHGGKEDGGDGWGG